VTLTNIFLTLTNIFVTLTNIFLRLGNIFLSSKNHHFGIIYWYQMPLGFYLIKNYLPLFPLKFNIKQTNKNRICLK
jgi:hypothetical protein